MKKTKKTLPPNWWYFSILFPAVIIILAVFLVEVTSSNKNRELDDMQIAQEQKDKRFEEEKLHFNEMITMYEANVSYHTMIIKECDSIITEKTKIIEYSKTYKDFIAKKAEYQEKKDWIMRPYDRRPYQMLAKKVKENPEIIEKADFYTDENLRQVKYELELALSDKENSASMLPYEQEMLESYRTKLDSLLSIK